MFATALLSQALLAASALALPSSHERYARRIQRRALGVHLSKPSLRHDIQPLALSEQQESNTATDDAHVQYSGNWAGEPRSSVQAPFILLTTAAQALFSLRTMHVLYLCCTQLPRR